MQQGRADKQPSSASTSRITTTGSSGIGKARTRRMEGERLPVSTRMRGRRPRGYQVPLGTWAESRGAGGRTPRAASNHLHAQRTGYDAGLSLSASSTGAPQPTAPA